MFGGSWLGCGDSLLNLKHVIIIFQRFLLFGSRINMHNIYRLLNTQCSSITVRVIFVELQTTTLNLTMAYISHRHFFSSIHCNIIQNALYLDISQRWIIYFTRIKYHRCKIKDEQHKKKAFCTTVHQAISITTQMLLTHIY